MMYNAFPRFLVCVLAVTAAYQLAQPVVAADLAAGVASGRSLKQVDPASLATITGGPDSATIKSADGSVKIDSKKVDGQDVVTVTTPNGTFTSSATTNGNGQTEYSVSTPNGTYKSTVDKTNPNLVTVTDNNGKSVTIDAAADGSKADITTTEPGSSGPMTSTVTSDGKSVTVKNKNPKDGEPSEVTVTSDKAGNSVTTTATTDKGTKTTTTSTADGTTTSSSSTATSSSSTGTGGSGTGTGGSSTGTGTQTIRTSGTSGTGAGTESSLSGGQQQSAAGVTANKTPSASSPQKSGAVLANPGPCWLLVTIVATGFLQAMW